MGVGLEVNVDYLAVSVEDLTGTVRYQRRSNRDNRRLGSGPRARPHRTAVRDALDAAAAERVCGRPASPSPWPASSRRRPARSCSRRTWAGPTSPSPPSSSRGSGCRSWSRTRRTSRRSPSTGRARRSASTTSSACSARSASAAASCSAAAFSAARTASAASSGTSPSIRRPSLRLRRPRVRRDARRSGVHRTGRRHPPVAGRPRSLTDELVRRAQDGAPAVLTALDERGAGWVSRWRRRSTSSTSGPSCSAAASARSRRGSRTGSARRSRSARSPRGRDVRRRPSAFGDGAAVRGAAALSLRRVLDAPWIVADDVPPAKTDTDPRLRATGAERRWGSGTARRGSTTVFERSARDGVPSRAEAHAKRRRE